MTFHLTVVAFDGGNPPHGTNTTISVTVRSCVTDFSVNLSQLRSNNVFSVEENAVDGTTVGFVRKYLVENTFIENPSKERGSKMLTNIVSPRFFITGGNHMGTFGIVESTGELFVASQHGLDFEKISSFSLLIIVLGDTPTSPCSSIRYGAPMPAAGHVVNVTVIVIDVDDDGFRFSDEFRIETMSENLPIGTPVFSLIGELEDARKSSNRSHEGRGNIEKSTYLIISEVGFTVMCLL